jgi:L-threonylcarbamoyladenylate synthase
MVEAAAGLFEALHRLDTAARDHGLDAIVAELLPDEGLGRAVNDRLRRAAAHRERPATPTGTGTARPPSAH